MKLRSYAKTDIGMKRRINQDSFLQNDMMQLYVVADGMGGHRGGEVASQLAVDIIQNFCQQHMALEGRELLDQAINMSCKEINRASKLQEELTGMGTTVLALIFKEQDAFIGQVGDSRAYLLREGSLWQVTEDHSLLNEEIRAGRVAADQAANYQFKNVITRSVGYEEKVLVDVYHRQVSPKDMILMCSDGLSGLVEAEEIGKIIFDYGAEKGLELLIQLANDRGGDDNITALIVEVL